MSCFVAFEVNLSSAAEAVDAGHVDLSVFDWKFLSKRLDSGEFCEKVSEIYRFFTDTAASMEDWCCFEPNADWDDDVEDDEWDDSESSVSKRSVIHTSPLDDRPEQWPPPRRGPVIAEPKPGRNDPCFCGSPAQLPAMPPSVSDSVPESFWKAKRLV